MEETFFIKYQKSSRQTVQTFPAKFIDFWCAKEAAQAIEELGMYRVWVDDEKGVNRYDSWGHIQIY